MFIDDTTCCGMVYLVGINERRFKPENAVRELYYWDPSGAGAAIFTAAWDKKTKQRDHAKKNFSKLVSFIRKHKLGVVTVAPKTTNPVHSSWNRSAIWNVNCAALGAFAKKQGWDTEGKFTVRFNEWRL